MESSKYRPRLIDSYLAATLEAMGAVLIEGAKWCGKTYTGEHHAGSILYLSDPHKIHQYLMYVDTNIDMILNGATPRMIDEWQIAPTLWDAVRFEVDHRHSFGQFILTGSAVPAETNQILHTGTGRIARVLMRPMSLYESGDSTGTISLLSLFDSPKSIAAENPISSLEDVAFLMCRGGWPILLNISKEHALVPAREYYNGLIHSDINRVDNTTRDVNKVKRFLRSYARLQGSQATIKDIVNDINGVGNVEITDPTVYSYLTALRNIFVVEDMHSWNPNLRSKTTIRSTDTRYFVDPSIATEALGVKPKDLVQDLNTMGLIFETLCVRDLRVYAQTLDGEVYHYRDKTGLECDAVVHLHDGRYGLIEIKLGGEANIEYGASRLKKLASKIDTVRMKEPSFMMVLIGAGPFAYQRKEDGVYVVPIECLKN